MKVIKYIKSRLSMTLANKVGFMDIVSGDIVRYYIDCYGIEYMAISKFGYRVRVTPQTNKEK